MSFDSNLGRILPRLGTKPVGAIDVGDVAVLVASLHGEGLARESIRKTRSTLAMVLDFAGVQPNPARDRSVKLPREAVELTPPTASHVEAVLRLLPAAYRLPTLVLDATGMRIGDLEALAWGDVDEPDGRWRVRREVSKTGRPRRVPVGVGARDADRSDRVGLREMLEHARLAHHSVHTPVEKVAV